MDNLKPPNGLNTHEKHTEWPKWSKNFNIYKVLLLKCRKRKNINNQQPFCILLTSLAIEVTELDYAIELLNSFYKPNINEYVEAYKFNVREYKADENFSEYLSALRKLSKNCNFDV